MLNKVCTGFQCLYMHLYIQQITFSICQFFIYLFTNASIADNQNSINVYRTFSLFIEIAIGLGNLLQSVLTIHQKIAITLAGTLLRVLLIERFMQHVNSRFVFNNSYLIIRI